MPGYFGTAKSSRYTQTIRPETLYVASRFVELFFPLLRSLLTLESPRWLVRRKQACTLLLTHFHRRFIPNYPISTIHFFLDRPLGRVPLVDLLGSPGPRRQPTTL